MGKNPEDIRRLTDIPFLPITFFKSHTVKSFPSDPQAVFHSSGTTGTATSKHLVHDLSFYQQIAIRGFEHFYGALSQYTVLGLLPSYLENEHSSLIYMVKHMVEQSNDPDSGFFMNDYERLLRIVERKKTKKKVLLLGVSYALLDLAEKCAPDLSACVVMETGGMKGRRKEWTREDVHSFLSDKCHVEVIHSEYGMTELFSQAYARRSGLFNCPPWMKVFIREYRDPLCLTTTKSGGINVIDLANAHSCSFIATEDIGKWTPEGFYVLGRFDFADIRGCNLLVE